MLRLLAFCALALIGVSANDEDGPQVNIISRTGKLACTEEETARKGKWVSVHFKEIVDESSLEGPKGQVQFDSRSARNPMVVHLADEEAIPGWILGLDDACVNSTTTVVVPPHLAFNDGVTIRFEIEVLEVSRVEIEEASMFDALDDNADGQISLNEFEKYFKEFRKNDLDDKGNAPLGLFMKEDINQNAHLNWEEFTGPKGTAPPSLAAEIILKEKADPELSKKKKGDPYKFVVKPNLNGDAADPSAGAGEATGNAETTKSKKATDLDSDEL